MKLNLEYSDEMKAKIAEQNKDMNCKNYIKAFGFKDFLKTFKNKAEKKEMKVQYLYFAVKERCDDTG